MVVTGLAFLYGYSHAEQISFKTAAKCHYKMWSILVRKWERTVSVMFSQSINLRNWYHLIMIISVLSFYFIIVSTAKAYAISLEGFDFGDKFPPINISTCIISFHLKTDNRWWKLTFYCVHYVLSKVGDAAEKLEAFPKHCSEKENGWGMWFVLSQSLFKV